MCSALYGSRRCNFFVRYIWVRFVNDDTAESPLIENVSWLTRYVKLRALFTSPLIIVCSYIRPDVI
jgi:hypothetical protein